MASVTHDDRDDLQRGQAALDTEVWMVLEGAGAPLTVIEVQHRLRRSMVYSTVLTCLRRLYARGDVDRLRDGRTVRYAASDDGAGVAARGMLRALEATGTTGRSAALARFASIIAESDRHELLHAVTEVSAARATSRSRRPHLHGTH